MSSWITSPPMPPTATNAMQENDFGGPAPGLFTGEDRADMAYYLEDLHKLPWGTEYPMMTGTICPLETTCPRPSWIPQDPPLPPPFEIPETQAAYEAFLREGTS